MEEAEKRVLGQFRSRLAGEIVVTASFLSAFCEKSVLDEEMTKIVKSEDNYTAKAHKLLELLPKRGPKAFSTLMEILSITNPWLAEKMKTALHEEHNREAKLKITASASEASSIKGYGSSTSRGNIDNDLRSTAHNFVKSSLEHLTESEQRTTEKWLGEELQRERRRQQFRSPHSFRRQPHEFQSCKEVQTDMKGMELHELCEDIMIQLHGVDYIHMNRDLSFKMLQKQIMELLQRLQKMDLLFIQCLEKFEDTDRYTLSLPELIDRSVLRQKELVRALMEDRRKIHLMTEERDSLERHVRHLEEEVEHMLKSQSRSVVHPQQMYLKKRKELCSRYTVTKHNDKPKKAPVAEGGGAGAGGGGGGTGRGGGIGGGEGGGGSARAYEPTITTTLPTSPHLGEEEKGGEEGASASASASATASASTIASAPVSASASATSSPKARVRFASATGSRYGTSSNGRRRPGTSSGPKSALKHPTK